MKKILALVIAVVMLAAMAVPAMAAPITEDAEAAIRFVVGGISELPAAGPFCPVNHGPSPTAAAGGRMTGGWLATGDFAFLNEFASFDIDFGYRSMPAMGPVTFAATDAMNNASPPVALPQHLRYLGMGVQGWVQHGSPLPPGSPIVNLPTGAWTLTMTLFEFEVVATSATTLQGFEMDLTRVSTAPRTPTTFPGGLTFGPAATTDWYAHTIIDKPQNDASAAAGTWTRPTAARGNTGAVFAWEYAVTLHGDNTGSNISDGLSQADILWAMTIV